MPRPLSRFAAVFALLGLLSFPLAVAAQVLPQVSVTATDSNGSEPGVNTGTFTLTRTGDTTAAITVGYGVGGTATAGSDYTALSGSVAMGVGASTSTITVTPLDDLLDESRETVVVTLVAGSGYTVGSPSAATVTIGDNDGVDKDTAHGKAEGVRPGWGWGDPNHVHYGPPGQGCTATNACAGDDTTAGVSATHRGQLQRGDGDVLKGNGAGREGHGKAANHGHGNPGRAKGHK